MAKSLRKTKLMELTGRTWLEKFSFFLIMRSHEYINP